MTQPLYYSAISALVSECICSSLVYLTVFVYCMLDYYLVVVCFYNLIKMFGEFSVQ